MRIPGPALSTRAAKPVAGGLSLTSPSLHLSFRQGGNAQPYCTLGWSDPEPTETWCVGERSILDLPLPRQTGSHVLTLHLRPHVSRNLLSQRLRVSANGVPIGAFSVTGPTVRACIIPATVMHSSPRLQLVFETPDAARPADVGTEADSRPLACAFSSLRLDRNQYAEELAASFISNVPTSLSPSVELPLAELMLRFESLGQNCEFGLVQRQCGAEPLGLLRFAATSLASLFAALDGGFAGMGSSKSIQVEVSPTDLEYTVKDRSYGIAYHAWVKAGEMSAEELHQREIRRIPILIRKLLEEMTLAEKIFVFKGVGILTEDEVFPLSTTLRRYGPNKILFVCLADEKHPSGSVEPRSPGLLVGYIDRFAPGENMHDILLDQWISICRNALRYADLSARGLEG